MRSYAPSDFPIILTDAQNTPLYSKNLDLSGLKNSQDSMCVPERPRQRDGRTANQAIRVAINDTLVLNYVHYGDSELIQQLRWLPYIEISLAAIFILIAYTGFSYIKRSEQSNIWVGMAKETGHTSSARRCQVSWVGWKWQKQTQATTGARDNTAGDGERRRTAEQSYRSLFEDRIQAGFEGRGPVRGGPIRHELYRQTHPKSGNTVELVVETPGHFPAASIANSSSG